MFMSVTIWAVIHSRHVTCLETHQGAGLSLYLSYATQPQKHLHSDHTVSSHIESLLQNVWSTREVLTLLNLCVYKPVMWRQCFNKGRHTSVPDQEHAERNRGPKWEREPKLHWGVCVSPCVCLRCVTVETIRAVTLRKGRENNCFSLLLCLFLRGGRVML